MKCRHFFSFALVVFLSLFFGSFITTSDTFATSVSCSLVSSSDSAMLLSDSCDFSSLDSSVDWYYSVSNFPLSSNNRYLIFSIDSNVNSVSLPFRNGFSFSNVFSSGSVFSDFSFSFKDYVSLLPFASIPQYFKHYTYYRSLSSFDLTVSDTPPTSGIIPSGDISITSNGTYDVSSYATATVDVSAEVIQGDYHDDLIAINNSILICAAVCLVIYFFYCIYRLIIKNSGVY